MKKLSVIIPSRTEEYLHQLITSLFDKEPNWQSVNDWTIFVGDNGLTPAYADYLRSIGVIVYSVVDPFVFAKAINDGVKMSALDSDLLIMNDDAYFLTQNPLAQAMSIAKMAEDQHFGVIGIQVATGGVGNPDQARTVQRGTILETNVTVCFMGALIPRNVWNSVGELDESFVGYGFEDADFAIRVRRAGHKLGISSDIQIHHGLGGKEWNSTYRSVYDGVTMARMGKRARKIFDDKWNTYHQETI